MLSREVDESATKQETLRLLRKRSTLSNMHSATELTEAELREEADFEPTNKEHQWVRHQSKAFLGWVNFQLSQRDLWVDSLTDLSSGEHILNLIEILEKKPLFRKRQLKHRPMYLHKVENLNAAFDYLNSTAPNGRQLGMGATSILSDKGEVNLSLILGLIWQLILRYAIAEKSTYGAEGFDDSLSEDSLLWWLRQKLGDKVDDADEQIQDFTTCWQDGHLFLNLVDVMRPGSIDFAEIREASEQQKLSYAFSAAERELRIPRILEPLMVNESPDQQSIMTYLSLFRNWDARKAKPKMRRMIEGARAGLSQAARRKRLMIALASSSGAVLVGLASLATKAWTRERNSVLGRDIGLQVISNIGLFNMEVRDFDGSLLGKLSGPIDYTGRPSLRDGNRATFALILISVAFSSASSILTMLRACKGQRGQIGKIRGLNMSAFLANIAGLLTYALVSFRDLSPSHGALGYSWGMLFASLFLESVALFAAK